MKNAKLMNFKISNFQSSIVNRHGSTELTEVSSIVNSGRAGFTLIEVIVAIAILAISLVMVMQLFSGGLRASRASCDYTRAIVHAKDKMEELSVEPVQGSGDFEDGFKWESEIQPLEELNKELEDIDVNIFKIKIKVSWFNLARQQKSVELVSLKTIKNENAK